MTERSPTLGKFAQKHGCDIEYTEYDAEDELLKMIQNLPNYYDVVVTTTDIIKSLLAAGRLAKISPDLVPNIRHVIPKYASIPADPKGEYFVPYMVGTTGIAYRRDLVGHDVTSWKDYFEPAETLKGKIGALDTFYNIPFAMKYMGIDIHTRDRNQIKKAAMLLFNLKKNGFLVEIISDPEEIRKKLISGELAMATLYSGDALSAADEDPRGMIRYALPKEGGEFYIDSMTIPKDAPNKELAHKFIDFILEPEINAAIVVDINYTTPNRNAPEFIKKTKPEYLSNPGVYPPAEVMERLEMFKDLDFEEFRRLWRKIAE